MTQTEKVNELTSRLIDRLKQVQIETTDSPETERRAAFRSALQEALKQSPPETTEQVLQGIRARFIEEARQRDQRLVDLERQVRRLTEERDSLQQVGEQLTRENDQLRQSGGRAAAAPAPSSAGGSGLDRMRAALRQMTDGKEVTAESVGLPASDARLFGLIQELLRFAEKYEMGVNLLLADIGSANREGGMDTMMMKGLKAEVRARFRACLDDQEGSLQRLKDLLARNAKFVIDLHTAYDGSFTQGIRDMLKELDPQPILDSKKRMIGFDYEEAWKEFSRLQSDMAGLSKSDLWERFLLEPFQEKLSGYLG